MQHFRNLIVIVLTALFAVPAYLSMAYADVSAESQGKAFLIMAIPNTIPISQLNNSALIDLRAKEAFNANPIKGASNMDYADALKAIESGKLDNKALLFVYTTSPKSSYSQDLEDSESMQTYQNERRQGPIRRLISFIMSLFGTTSGSTNTGTGVEGTGNEPVGGITGEETDQPKPPVIGGSEDEEMGQPTPPEEITVGDNGNGFLPPLEEITPPVNEEDNNSLSEEDNASDNSELTNQEEPVAFNPLLPANNQDNEETIIPVQPVKPGTDENIQKTMNLEKITKALSQRGYNFTVIPFN
jgi:hypothetical protein